MGTRKHRRKTVRMLVTPVAAVAFRAIQLLPLGVVYRLAAVVARLIYALPSRRRLLDANLAVAFPEWDGRRRQSVALRSLRNVCCTFLEFIWFMPRHERIVDHVTIDDDVLQLLRTAADNGSGSIFLTPHLGNWEFANLTLNAHGLHMTSVYAKINNPYVERTIVSGRTRFGGGLITERGAAKAIMRLLRGGQTVGLLIDQNTRPRHGGIFVDFFSLPVPVSRAPATFARKAGASVIVLCCVRDDRDRLHFKAATLPRPGAEYESDEALITDINRQTETWIRRCPDQYLWLYRRWLYRPEDIDAATRAKYPFYSKDV
ncbi:MAG: lysophospholipid acyltransferase family protein [Lentisphaeria bacterium]|nr:lysophospholipid acyltransferase family protein [Lentisphaeria bacterium]